MNRHLRSRITFPSSASTNPAAWLTRICCAALFGVAAALPASAHILHYYAELSGATESPANASPGTGLVLINYDPHTSHLEIIASFTNLLGNVTAAHIHAPTAVALTGTAGVATMTPTFVGFPAGVTSGSYSNTFDLALTSSYNAAFVTANGNTPAGAEAALAAAFAAGKAYFNLHTTSFGGGEIRGFVLPVPATIPHIEAIELAPPNLVLLHFDTEANRTYTLETTTTPAAMGSWQPFYVVPSQSFASHYVVPDNRTNAHSFYRLKAVP